MTDALSLPQTTQEKFLQLADFLEQASLLARELGRRKGCAKDCVQIPDLTPPKVIPKDQAWFWSDEWQAGERKVNEELKRGEYATFDNVEAFLADLQTHV